jgi:hydrogenase expression/formation protein HypE
MSDKNVIKLAHGGGGFMTRHLLEEVFLPAFGNPILNRLDDSAFISLPGTELAFTTDSFVVKPVFFPGGDIGRLAVCGTVNDLAAAGAEPKYISAGFIIEEGFLLDDLKRIVRSMKKAADEAGVCVAAGDTKVVEKGHCDGIFINTSGIGLLEGSPVSGSGARPGDAVLVNGTLGRHGLAVVTARAELGFSDRIESDVAPLNRLASSVRAACGVHAMRDATRGGLAAVLNEIAAQSGAAVELEEGWIPLDDDVRAACAMLGFDPLYVANEGVMVFFLPEEQADKAVAAMKANVCGRSAARIGRVLKAPEGRVTLKTSLGSHRVVDMPSGEQLPRIC